MQGLPNMRYSFSTQSSVQRSFGGLNKRIGAVDGDICDMWNLTGDEFPLVTPRTPRREIETVEKPNGIFALDGLVIVAGTTVYYKDKEVGQLSDTKKIMCALGFQNYY